jgi:hypothetical protein
MGTKSVLFDAPARSGNHFAVAILVKAFPDVKFYWGYKQQHSPHSFSLTKDKVNYILSVLRNPLDSIASLIALNKTYVDETIESYINDNKNIMTSILENKNNIHMFSFEYLTSDIKEYIKDVSKIVESEPVDIDYQKIKNTLDNYYGDGFYVYPIDNQEDKNVAKEVLLLSHTDKINECIDLYRSLQQYVIK